jgi:hypothetical protein
MNADLDFDAIIRMQLRLYLIAQELERMKEEFVVPSDLEKVVPADYKPTEH